MSTLILLPEIQFSFYIFLVMFYISSFYFLIYI